MKTLETIFLTVLTFAPFFIIGIPAVMLMHKKDKLDEIRRIKDKAKMAAEKEMRMKEYELMKKDALRILELTNKIIHERTQP